MKHSIATAIALVAICVAQAAPVQFKTDFSGGIPPEIILIDGDGNTPATGMAAIGFEVGRPWIGYYIEEEDEHVACSTSWYKPAGTSDDWMILPAISVEEGATLHWRARSSDKKYFDGFAVYASVQGTDREAFDIDNPLFSIAEQSNSWTEYSIDLSSFAGQDLNLAFVNNSTNKARLYIDDIMAGTSVPLQIDMNMPGLYFDNGEPIAIPVSGSIITELEDPSALGDITISYGHQSINIPNNSLIANQPVAFEFSEPLVIADGAAGSVDIAASSASGHHIEYSQHIWPALPKIVVEEFTGTWCAWCVRGIVYMESLKEYYGESMIPLCVHIDDAMTVKEYTDNLDYLQQISIPNSIVNRKYECDPANLYSWCQKCLMEAPQATFTNYDLAYSSENNSVKISTKVAFENSQSSGKYSTAFIAVEDNVCVPGDPRYMQKNAYAGGVAGEMGGFENLPEYIVNMNFRDVVRSISVGGPHGMPNSLPDYIKAGQEYAVSYTMQLPSSILNPAEVAIVAIIIDNATGEILNGVSLALKDYDPDLGGVGYIATTYDDSISVYLPNGQSVGTYADIDSFRASNSAPGLYIVKDTNGAASKILLR